MFVLAYSAYAIAWLFTIALPSCDSLSLKMEVLVRAMCEVSPAPGTDRRSFPDMLTARGSSRELVATAVQGMIETVVSERCVFTVDFVSLFVFLWMLFVGFISWVDLLAPALRSCLLPALMRVPRRSFFQY